MLQEPYLPSPFHFGFFGNQFVHGHHFVRSPCTQFQGWKRRRGSALRAVHAHAAQTRWQRLTRRNRLYTSKRARQDLQMPPYPIRVLHQEQWAWHQAQGLVPVHYLNLAARAPTARIDDAESTALRMGTASTPGVERSDAHSPAAMVVRPALSTTSPTTSEARMDEGAMTIASLTAKCFLE